MSERLKTILALASLGLFLLAADACVRSVLPPTRGSTLTRSSCCSCACPWTEAKRVEETSTGSDAGRVTPAKKN